jgi:hypothetical protein
MSPEDARRDALMKFGGVESAKEAYRDQRGLPLLEDLAQDTRYAFRQIGKYPGFVAIVILTLGLGTGATTAVFSVVNTVLLRPLPYKDPSRLVRVAQRYSLSLGPGFVLGPDYRAWRRENSSFEEIEAFYGAADTSLASKGAATAVRAIGVLPGSVRYPEADVWTPISLDSPMFTAGSRPIFIVNVIGRLREGITTSQAESDLNVIGRRIDNQWQQWVVQMIKKVDSRFSRVYRFSRLSVVLSDH